MALRNLGLFILTPLPGSEDHQTLWKQGVWMDPDFNKFDVHHRDTVSMCSGV